MTSYEQSCFMELISGAMAEGWITGDFADHLRLAITGPIGSDPFRELITTFDINTNVHELTAALIFAEEKMRLISKLLNEGHDFINKGKTVEIFADQLKAVIAAKGPK